MLSTEYWLAACQRKFSILATEPRKMEFHIGLYFIYFFFLFSFFFEIHKIKRKFVLAYTRGCILNDFIG